MVKDAGGYVPVGNAKGEATVDGRSWSRDRVLGAGRA